MSGIADNSNGLRCEAWRPLRFSEFIARANRAEQIERAAGPGQAAAEGEGCRHRCHAPAARRADTPRLGEVRPVPAPYAMPARVTPQITIQQLLPIGSIIDVTI